MGNAGALCQQMTEDASKILFIGEKPGESFSADLAQVIEVWPLLPEAMKHAILEIVDAGKQRREVA